MPGDLKIWLEQLQKKVGEPVFRDHVRSGGFDLSSGRFALPAQLPRQLASGTLADQSARAVLSAGRRVAVSVGLVRGQYVRLQGGRARLGRGTGIDDRGLVTFDRKYRKDAFYFYKANWNKAEPMVYIAQKRWTPRVKTTQSDPGLFECSGSGTAGQRRFARKKTGANGVFLWENVELKRGVNALEARSDTGIDYADIRVL